jgi:hypothetical protein
MFQFIFFAIRLCGGELGFLAMGGRTVLLIHQPPHQTDLFTAQEAKHPIFPGLILPARF